MKTYSKKTRSRNLAPPAEASSETRSASTGSGWGQTLANTALFEDDASPIRVSVESNSDSDVLIAVDSEARHVTVGVPLGTRVRFLSPLRFHGER